MSDLSRARPANAQTVLVIDDEPDLRTLYELTLVREGYEIDTAGSVEEALLRLAETSYGVIITDMRLPDGSGLDLLRELEDNGRAEKAIVITAYGSAENAVEALKAGAYDYLTKPVDLKQFRAVVASALGRAPFPAPPAPPAAPAAPAVAGASPAPPAAPPATAGSAAPARTRSPTVLPGGGAMGRMAGESSAMQQVRGLVHKVARSMAPVLVQGESGTGKELVARAIHEVSARAGRPFIAVNCGAIPEQLLEAEFFGFRKGAFTGAAEDRVGFFQAASGGTLFLDEIGDLPLAMQSKLLRAIQERAVRPVGAVAEVPVDVRLLSATHKDLATEVQFGRFRQDLYYRLNVIQIRVPPLRERIEDLPAIATRVLERIAHDAGVSPAPRLTALALAHLMAYGFPGNVRELENLLHRVVALCDGESIDVVDLGLPDDAWDVRSATAPTPMQVVANAPAWAPTQPMGVVAAAGLPAMSSATLTAAVTAAAPAPATLPSDLESYLDGVERDILVRALERHRNNRTAAGASLGLSLRQMRYRMARLQVGVGHDAGAEAEPAREAGGTPDAAR